MEVCYVLFGSNMGDKAALFDRACQLMEERCGAIKAVSSAYGSEPWGFEAEEWFYNRLVVVETGLSPDGMMLALLDIESELGRRRVAGLQGYQSRPVDLDILYFGDRIVHTDRVTVPHPRLHLRRFALLPLCELVPHFEHPVFKLTQEALLERCPDTSKVAKLPLMS